MPYIERTARLQYAELIDSLFDMLDQNDFHSGHLNYVIYSLLKRRFMKHRGYSEGSRLRGVMFDVAEEFYRRLLAPYEEQMIDKNGDV